MTLTGIINGPVAGGMTESRLESYTYTTTVDTYEVIGTLSTANYPGCFNSIYVTTNNLLFKFEYTRDGVTWVTAIEDYPISAAANGQVATIRQALQYRVSVKPAVAGNHGSCTWLALVSKTVLPPEYRAAFAYEAKTVTSAAAVALTTTTYNGAFAALITVEDNPVRVRWDGTAPTSAEGHLLQSGDTVKLDFAADIFKFKAIATGADAKIRVTYSR